MHFLEDLEDGRTFKLGSIGITRENILMFAREFDPQAFHLDESVAGEMFGGLIASGWHTASLGMRLVVEGFLKNTNCMGSPGVDELRFVHPVFGGDVLTGTLTVIGTKPSSTKPDRGLATCKIELFNGSDQLVLRMLGLLIIGCRPPAGS